MKYMDYVKRVGIARPYAGDYGIEIETESRDPYTVPQMKHWRHDTDGSLRDFGVEYILSKPVNYGSIDEALCELKDSVAGVEFKESAYTSVHVHVNISRMTLTEVASFYTAYCLFEEVLNRYCGPTRNGNLFCLKNSLANRSVNTFTKLYRAFAVGDVHKADNILFDGSFNENQLKYAACNIAPMTRFQSLEIRTHKGTTDTTEVKRWVDIIECIKKFSLEFKPNEIVKYYHQEKNKTVIMKSVFGDLHTYLMSEHLNRDLSVGLFYALQVAKSSSDWGSLNTKIQDYLQEKKEEEPVKKKKISRTGGTITSEYVAFANASLDRNRNAQYTWDQITQTVNAPVAAPTPVAEGTLQYVPITDEWAEDFEEEEDF